MAEKKIKVRFLTSPTGRYKLAYNAGDIAVLPAELAKEIIENSDGEEVKEKTNDQVKSNKRPGKRANNLGDGKKSPES